MRYRHDAKSYQWKENELLFIYKPYMNIQIILTLEQWDFKF